MPQIQVQDDDDVILVEFAPTPGVRSVSLSPADIAEKSNEAIDHAMKSMQSMAKKTVKAIKEIPVSERPNTITVSFGLKIDVETSVVIVQKESESIIKVSMTWNKESNSKKS